MLWLKKPKPEKAPPAPKRISTVQLATLRIAARAQPDQPLNAYLLAHLPPEEFDRWLQPLPLSAVQQDRLDRMMAVLEAPIDRGRALLVSGTLDTLECQALREGQPKAYEILRTWAIHDMVAGKPPLPGWSEGVLGVLFGREASHVFAEEKTDKSGKPAGQGFSGKLPAPTPSEQRDNIQRR